MKMKDICTKTGDGGTTSLRGGVRVPKDDIRIETNGEIDHLNALLGVVRAQLDISNQHKGVLQAIQRELMVVMSHVATPEGMENARKLHAGELTTQMEVLISQSEAPATFVVPGNHLLSAQIHLARTQARAVKRRLWTLSRQHPVDRQVLVFFNRLSDYLFVMALEED